MEGSTVYNTVFIDTNLDTHLALIVSDVDTVANLKKKIMYEHPLCFPNFGEIKIHALKVKRKGYFYHLTDHMFVKSAFDGSKKNWFLSIDAASVINNDKSKLSSDPGSSNALLCVTNGPLADGVDLLPDGTSKKLSFMDGSKLHQFDGDHLLNQEVPIAEHFGPDTSIRGVLKDLEMEVKHVSGNHCKTSSSDSSQKFDSGLQEKCYSKGNEMLGRPTNCKKDNSQNEIRDLQFNFPLVENLQDGAVSKKKVKSKRKFESLVDSCALKVNDGSIDASCKDILEQEITVPHNACKGFHNDTGLENKHIRDEPSKDLSSDWEKTQVIGMSAENNDGILKEKVVNVQPRVSMGEASEVVTAAKKKRKIEKKGKAPLNENEALICISSKETYKSENIITKDDKETTTVPYVSLSTGLPKDDSMIVNNTKSEKKTTKKKKKPSSSKKDVAVTVPFSMEDVGEERSKETLGMSQKNSDKESDEAVDHVQTVQDAMCAEPCSVSLRNIITEDDRQETTTVPCDSLSTGLPKDDSMIVNNTKSEKKKTKKKKKPSSSKKDVAVTVPFSMEDVREERSKETLGMSQKDSDKESDEAVDHVQTVQDAMCAEPCSISFTKDDKQETKTVPYDSLSTELPKDDNMIVNNSKSEKKTTKKKKKPSSSNKDKAATVPFSMEDIREEHSKETLGMSQKDSDENFDEAVDHVQTIQDVMHAEPCSISSRNKLSVTVQEVGAVREVFTHDTDPSVVDAEKTRNEMKSSQNNDPKVMLPEKSKPSDQGEKGMGMNEVVISSELLDKVKERKKTKNTDGEIQVTSGIEHANSSVGGITSSEHHKAVDSDKKAKKGKNVMSQTARTQVAEIETMNSLSVGAIEEALEVHENVVESVHPMPASKSEEIPDTWDVKGRKKSGKKRGSTVENLPDVHMKEQYVGHSSIDKTKETDVPSKKKKKSTLVETGSEIPINESNLQSQKDTVNKLESLQCQAGVDVDSTSGPADESIKKIGDSHYQGDRIEFSDYFLPRQQQHEVAGLAEAVNDKVIDVERSRKMEAKKNSEMVDRHSVGTSRDLHDPLRSNDNHGSETGSGVGNSCTIQGSFRKDESDKLLPRSKKKSSKVSDNKVEAQCSASRPNIVKVSVTTTPDQSNMKEIEKASSALSSSSERVSHKYKSQSNQKSVTTKKASGENSGKNISNHGKSLLAISGSIFKDDNDDSSDDDGFVDSDASTRTPSDDSSSSNYSEVENKTGSSHRTKKMVDGGNSSSLKNMTLDAILKSSNRFKKAKITASQSQYEDTESQPVDIVPDSQANL